MVRTHPHSPNTSIRVQSEMISETTRTEEKENARFQSIRIEIVNTVVRIKHTRMKEFSYLIQHSTLKNANEEI
jgi:hypothetical protein